MINGFSKLSRLQKIAMLNLDSESKEILAQSAIQSEYISDIIDELSENTIAYYTLPLGIAPNIVMNGKTYFLPLVTEESSVVAAISNAAKFWRQHGGFQAHVNGTQKKGHVHFFWTDSPNLLKRKFKELKQFILLRIAPLNRKMKKRGAGLQTLELIDKTNVLNHYFQIEGCFETADAMGANFINSCVEEISKALKQFVACDTELNQESLEINMSILSNYTPNSKAIAQVSCSIDQLNDYGKQIGINNYTSKFIRAIEIADCDINRAVTHNKGIYNGVDSLAMATGNDWRAIEACGHAYAAKDGQYRTLSAAYIENDTFYLKLELPLAVGSVGGVTNLHPMAKMAIKILGNPNSELLMQLMAVSGLAANFAAINALISSGIQKGHMKMHLSNILNQLNATQQQKKQAGIYFSNKTVSFSSVEQWLNKNKD